MVSWKGIFNDLSLSFLSEEIIFKPSLLHWLGLKGFPDAFSNFLPLFSSLMFQDVPWSCCPQSFIVVACRAVKTCLLCRVAVFNCFLFVFFSVDRTTPGLNCTPLPYSRQWATCCALVTADRHPRVCQISGWLCWVWL